MKTDLESNTVLFFQVDHNHKDLGSGWEALTVVMQKVLQQVEIPEK